MVRVVAYYRMSSDGQGGSIEQQQDIVRAWAASQGYDVVAEFVEPGISGLVDEDRPQFMAMVDAARAMIAWRKKKAPEPALTFDGVIAWKTCRISRANSGKQLVPDVFQDAQVFLHTVTESKIEFDSMPGRILYGVLSEMNNGYSVTLSYNVTRGRNRALSEGTWAHGRVAYGFLKEVTDNEGRVFTVTRHEQFKRPKAWAWRVVENIEEADIVRRVFREYVDQRLPISDIAKRLTADAIETPNRRTVWHPNMVREILRNKAYAGYAYTGKDWRAPKGKVPINRLAKTEKAGVMPEVVTLKTWEAAQVILDANSTAFTDRQKRTPRRSSILSGHVRCGICGHAMATYWRGDRPQFRCCHLPGKTCPRWRVHEDELLPVVVRKLRQSLDEAELRLATLPTDAPNTNAKRTERLKKRLEKLERDMRNAARNKLTADPEDRATLDEVFRELKAELEKARAEFEAAVAPSDECRKAAEKVAKIKDRLLTLVPDRVAGGGLMVMEPVTRKGVTRYRWTGEVTPQDQELVVTKPGVKASPDELRAFLRRINFTVVVYPTQTGGGATRKRWGLDNGRVEAVIGEGVSGGPTIATYTPATSSTARRSPTAGRSINRNRPPT